MPDRTLVAISDDRQFLTALSPGLPEWTVMEWRDWGYEDMPNFFCVDIIVDTGQGAEDVLRAFLEERSAGGAAEG